MEGGLLSNQEENVIRRNDIYFYIFLLIECFNTVIASRTMRCLRWSDDLASITVSPAVELNRCVVMDLLND